MSRAEYPPDRHLRPPRSVRLSADDDEWLVAYAAEIGDSPHAVIRRAIAAYRANATAIRANATEPASATDANELCNLCKVKASVSMVRRRLSHENNLEA